MANLESKKDVEKIAMELLRQSKSLDVFPTPVDNIVKYANLTVEMGIDLSKIDRSILSKMSEKFGDVLQLIRGFLDREEKIVILDLSMLPQKQNFVKLHETGHEVLGWQGETVKFLDVDQTLDPTCIEIFEAEANYFASYTLFQGDRFFHKMKKLDLGIKSPIHLAKEFGSSIHAALRKYVELSKDRCALLVLENPNAGIVETYKRDYFQSVNFTKTFGLIDLPERFGYTWPFAREYCFSTRKTTLKEGGAIQLNTQNGKVDFVYHFFKNGYNAFVFLFPLGEVRKSKTKIILRNES